MLLKKRKHVLVINPYYSLAIKNLLFLGTFFMIFVVCKILFICRTESSATKTNLILKTLLITTTKVLAITTKITIIVSKY